MKTHENLITLNENKYINEYSYNTQWIVWIETDINIISLSGQKPKEWTIKAFNILTNDEFIVDASNLVNSNQNSIPNFKQYLPKNLSISDNNELLYSKIYDENDDNLIIQMLLYNLNSQNSIVIREIDDVFDKDIQGIHKNNDYIVWAESHSFDDTLTLSTQYTFSDIYIIYLQVQ